MYLNNSRRGTKDLNQDNKLFLKERGKLQVSTMKLKPKIKEKRWVPTIEKHLLKEWIKNKTYRFDIRTRRKIFSIDTPPPYPRPA